MKKAILLITILCAIPCFSLAKGNEQILNEIKNADYIVANENTPTPSTTQEYSPKIVSLIVTFKENALNSAREIPYMKEYSKLMDNIYLITFETQKITDVMYKYLKSDPNIAGVDYNMEIRLDVDDEFGSNEECTEDNIKSPYDVSLQEISTPNDYQTYGSGQWQLEDIGALNAWKELEKYEGATQRSAVVAVLDSGIDTSSDDLKNRILTDGNGNMIGYNVFYSAYKNFEDDFTGVYHGTKVSSIISAEANNGYGICGVAGPYDVKILPIKVFNSAGSSTAAGLIEGVNVAIENHVDVINMSLAGTTPIYYNDSSSGTIYSLQTAINTAVENGICVVAASGNNFSNQPLYPASYENVISVAAYSPNRVKSNFSQYNDYIDLCAPGDDLSLLSKNDSNQSIITSATCSGTSFSCPIVSASAALLRIAYPQITPQEITNVLKHSATDLGKENYDILYGFGAVNLEKAIKNAYTGIVEVKTVNYPKYETVIVDQFKQIKATVLPVNAQNRLLKWESSDTTVATVSNNGVVFGVSPGEADIYISTDNDENFSKDENGTTFFCRVQVLPNIILTDEINLNIGTPLSLPNISQDEFLLYSNNYIWRASKNLVSQSTDFIPVKQVDKDYKFTEVLSENAKYSFSSLFTYILANESTGKIALSNSYSFPLNSTYSFTDPGHKATTQFLGFAHNNADFSILTNENRILHFESPKKSSESYKVTSESIAYNFDNIAYVSDSTCYFYIATGVDTDKNIVIALSNNGYSDWQIKTNPISTKIKKILVDSKIVYLLTDDAIYYLQVGRVSSSSLGMSQAYKLCDIDNTKISNISFYTSSGKKLLIGYGLDNNIYAILKTGIVTPIQSIENANNVSYAFSFNGEFYSIADGVLKSTKIMSAQNNSLTPELCTYKTNILDEDKNLVQEVPEDGKFTVEILIESINRIIFANSKLNYKTAQNRLPVQVIISVYNNNTGKLADIKTNNFLLDYNYLDSNPNNSFGALLRWEETFDLPSGDYNVKVMTFKGNNFYWPEKGNESTTMDVFTKVLQSN